MAPTWRSGVGGGTDIRHAGLPQGQKRSLVSGPRHNSLPPPESVGAQLVLRHKRRQACAFFLGDNKKTQGETDRSRRARFFWHHYYRVLARQSHTGQYVAAWASPFTLSPSKILSRQRIIAREAQAFTT